MISVGEERSKQGWEEQFIGLMDSFPDRVWDATWARGGGLGGFSKCGGHFCW